MRAAAAGSAAAAQLASVVATSSASTARKSAAVDVFEACKGIRWPTSQQGSPRDAEDMFSLIREF